MWPVSIRIHFFFLFSFYLFILAGGGFTAVVFRIDFDSVFSMYRFGLFFIMNTSRNISLT